jgi:hypothetical protein
MEFVGNQLYLGSEYRDHGILWRAPVEEPDGSLETVDVPEEVVRAGKAVDAFDLRDDRLLAVDNIALPKYFLTYDVTDPVDPNLTDVAKMPHHGTYESVFAADSSTSWIAMASGSVGHGGVTKHISLVDPATLSESTAIRYADFRDALTRIRGSSPEFPVDVAVTDDFLYLARGSRGVEVFKIEDILQEKPEPMDVPEEVRSSSPPTLDASDVPSRKIAPESDAEVIAVQTLPGQEGCFATLKFDKLEHGWEWLEP